MPIPPIIDPEPITFYPPKGENKDSDNQLYGENPPTEEQKENAEKLREIPDVNNNQQENVTMSTNLEQDEKIGALYVGFFDRLADSNGMSFWQNQISQGATMEDVSQSFYNSQEGQQMFSGLSQEDKVNKMYNQIFNRDAEQDGLNYWTNQLQQGNVSEGDLMLALINGAQNTSQYDDKSTVQGMSEASVAYAQAGQNNLSFADKFEDVAENYDTNPNILNSSSFNGEFTIDEYEEEAESLFVEYEVRVVTDEPSGNGASIIAREVDLGLPGENPAQDSISFSSAQTVSDLDDGLLVA